MLMSRITLLFLPLLGGSHVAFSQTSGEECNEAMVRADVNRNGQISKAEYIRLLLVLSPYSDCPTLNQLSTGLPTSAFNEAFAKLSCTCVNNVTSSFCCQGSNPFLTVTETASDYADMVCSTLYSAIQSECGPVSGPAPAPETAPAPAPETGVGTPQPPLDPVVSTEESQTGIAKNETKEGNYGDDKSKKGDYDDEKAKDSNYKQDGKAKDTGGAYDNKSTGDEKGEENRALKVGLPVVLGSLIVGLAAAIVIVHDRRVHQRFKVEQADLRRLNAKQLEADAGSDDSGIVAS